MHVRFHRTTNTSLPIRETDRQHLQDYGLSKYGLWTLTTTILHDNNKLAENMDWLAFIQTHTVFHSILFYTRTMFRTDPYPVCIAVGVEGAIPEAGNHPLVQMPERIILGNGKLYYIPREISVFSVISVGVRPRIQYPNTRSIIFVYFIYWVIYFLVCFEWYATR